VWVELLRRSDISFASRDVAVQAGRVRPWVAQETNVSAWRADEGCAVRTGVCRQPADRFIAMQFDTKIAVVIRTDLEVWQKLNVASFLAGGIAASFPECIGENYEDGSGTRYLTLIGQPILIYGADGPALSRALERALARNVQPALYTEDMFRTTHDAANREVVKAVARSELNLVGLAIRAERKVVDKVLDGLKFHT
jgi:hypothetical protein